MSNEREWSNGNKGNDHHSRDVRRVSRRTVLRFGAATATLAAAQVVPGAGVGRALAQGTSKIPDLEFKFGHPYNVKHPLSKGVEKFASLVSQRTDGHVKITIYPNSTIGASQSLVTGMQIGVVDMALVPTTDVATFYKPLDVFYLPFIFSGHEQAYRVSDGPVGHSLYKDMNEKIGIRTLAMFESGFRTITTRETAVHSPGDLNGLKMRVPNNPINIATFRALGANATPMAISEVFTALQQGTVDGQDNPIGNVYAYGFYKVQGYETLSDHQWAGIMFLANGATWGRLPKDLQAILQDAAIESQNWERAELKRKNDDYLKIMQKDGLKVIRLTAEEKARFREKTQAVWHEYGKGLGKDLIQRVRDA